MKRSYEEKLALIFTMQARQAPTVQRMRDVLARYSGDWVLPVPQVPNEPTMPNLAPALIGEAVDSAAYRACSVKPMVRVPPVSKYTTSSARRAEGRRDMVHSVFAVSRWELGRRRFHRHLAAYHTTAAVVINDIRLGMPRLEVEDPLGVLVEDRAVENLQPPSYGVFIRRLSGAWLRANHPIVREENGGPISAMSDDELWEVGRWYDEDERQFLLIGPCTKEGNHIGRDYAGGINRWYGYGAERRPPTMALTPALPNRLGRVPAVVPFNVTLGGVVSRIATMIGNVDLQAKLTALDLIAQEKAIFPDMYVVGRQQGNPLIVGGEWKDGRTGEMNMLRDVESVATLRTTPDIRTNQSIDRLERNLRISTGLIPQTGGETYGSLRTGRAIAESAGIALDGRIQEQHELEQTYVAELGSIILDSWKEYFPSSRSVFITGWGRDRVAEISPVEQCENNLVSVRFAIPGADTIQLTQILGSLLGTGTMSRETFAELHPWIEEPTDELNRVEEEQLGDALRASIIQQVQAGQMPAEVLVWIRDAIREGKSIFDAVTNANRKLQERQATPAGQAPPGMIAAPEAMPGLAGGPGAAMAPAAAPPTIEGPPQDVTNMRALMQAMGGGR